MQFVVNDKEVTTSAAERTPLLYVLRNELGLRAVKYGCGTGHCGACTVLVDGRPENSCEFLVSLVEGCRVTTLEGLPNADLHPVQQAFIEEQVPQCGLCISGWVMTSVALLERNPNVNDAEIRQSLSSLKCRCGTHMSILRAVKNAAKAMA